MSDVEFNSGWCFALVNGKLAEIHFEKGEGIWIHDFVDKSDYKTEKEQEWIGEDTEKYQFEYEDGVYFDLNLEEEFEQADPPWADRDREDYIDFKKIKEKHLNREA